MSSLKSIDPSGDTAKFINEALSYAKENNIHSAVMSMYMPYDVARYQNADALFAVYSSKNMPEIPTELDGETKTYGPGYTAALCAAFGYIAPQGKLPVDIYELEGTGYSDKILYNLGYGLEYEKNQQESIPDAAPEDSSEDSGDDHSHEYTSEITKKIRAAEAADQVIKRQPKSPIRQRQRPTIQTKIRITAKTQPKFTKVLLPMKTLQEPNLSCFLQI